MGKDCIQKVSPSCLSYLNSEANREKHSIYRIAICVEIPIDIVVSDIRELLEEYLQEYGMLEDSSARILIYNSLIEIDFRLENSLLMGNKRRYESDLIDFAELMNKPDIFKGLFQGIDQAIAMPENEHLVSRLLDTNSTYIENCDYEVELLDLRKIIFVEEEVA